MMENQHPPVCQSCGMPMSGELFGTNADGSKNEDYCVYCYKDGRFTQDVTMDQMIEHNLKYLDEFNGVAGTRLTPEQAREEMHKFFPQLKRWR